MDKIRQLMIESGLSDEAATKICGLLEAHESQLKTKMESDLATRLAKAKKVCMEEVQEHKRELARRFQVFVEAKTIAIEESLRKCAVDKETEAVAKLERISGLLEGIEINGQPNSELQARLTNLETRLKTVNEERIKAVKKANDATTLAERVLTRNRQLERTIREGSGGKPAKPAGTEQPKRLDESRQNGGNPTTTRPTNRANQQAARPVIVEGGARQRPAAGNQMLSPSDIAASMQTEL